MITYKTKVVAGKRVLGIDPSTHTGMTLISDDTQLLAKYVNFPKETGFRRLHLIATAVHNTAVEWQPDAVFIEDYALNNKFTRTEMVEVGTVIRKALYDLGLSWYTVPPTVLKKWVTGKGNADKKGMGAAVLEKWGYRSKYDDLVDSYGLAQLGKHVLTNGLTADIKGVIHHGNGLIQSSST